MNYQSTFERYELKYMLTHEQKNAILKAIEPHMVLDQYGRTVIRNIYFDTDNYRLIRKSIEGMTYKEKLRIRCYDRATAQSTVFVELKKKYDSVVYKRRIPLTEEAAMRWMRGIESGVQRTQISHEIDYFMDYYKTLRPTVFLSYEREAYCPVGGGDFRVTFDENVLCRQTDLSLQSDVWGTPVIDKDAVLMELKCSGGIPLWLTRVLSEQKIYKTSFSKYGTAYKNLIYPNLKEAL